ncbi:MAG: DUF389 domain-containing protein [Patescibacteria group bacterium]|jgi:uncharacterized hydrophobic protein (TIGR00271 family)|nr:DUF389 domain-containing protein [Patescibacteria group bacterium]
MKNVLDIFSFLKVEQSDRNNFCETIIESSAPKFDFYLLVVLSSLIVSFGLILDNIVLVIGGMLVTPLLSPILAISLGVVILNFKVILRSFKIFAYSAFWSMLIAFLVGHFNEFDISSITILGNMEIGYITFVISFIAGIAASYTWIKPDLNSILPGIAITVTLIPPLTASGLALTLKQLDYFYKFIAVTGINILGILLASMFVFTALQFYKSRNKLIAEVNHEEKEIKKDGIFN